MKPTKPTIKNQLTNVKVAARQGPQGLDKLLYKIGQCVDYQNLYAMENDFNACGLTIQTTANNRMILCKLVDSRPVVESVVDDYIFIGGLAEATNEISDRAASKISDFVRTQAGKPDKVKDIARVWRNGLRMYESVINILHENVNNIADGLINE